MGIHCPEDGCDGELAEKKTRRGKTFYGCSKYPDCKYASWDKPTDQKCPECGEAFLVEKSTKKKAGFLMCPACKHEVAP